MEIGGIEMYRRKYGRGFRPHISILLDGTEFHVDSSPGKRGWNLITHAHSDHYGQRNMDNPRAVASAETARILEAATEKEYEGITFDVGGKIRVQGQKIETYPTFHIHGSAAFFFRNVELLITGDVKDYCELPECRILVTEATYGHPSHVFEDEVGKLLDIASHNVVLGAYPIGKAQRVAEILKKEIGFRAEERVERICRAVGICPDENGPLIVSPRNLARYGGGYILTAQNFYRWPKITLSDHLDYRGLLEMIHHCNPETVVFYHGKPSKALIRYLESEKIECKTLEEIKN
ncbi:MBL fold metallo-hydrolase RNA specificity domain-containing protein [Archaeoglobus sp.]